MSCKIVQINKEQFNIENFHPFKLNQLTSKELIHEFKKILRPSLYIILNKYYTKSLTMS